MNKKVLIISSSPRKGGNSETLAAAFAKGAREAGNQVETVYLREAHKDDFFSVPEDNPLEDFLQTADEVASEDGDPEQASLAFICKRLKLNLKKLSEEEKKWLKKIAQKSDLLKNPNPQRGRK